MQEVVGGTPVAGSEDDAEAGPEDVNMKVNVVGISGAGPAGVMKFPAPWSVTGSSSDVVQSSDVVGGTGSARVEVVCKVWTCGCWLADCVFV